MTLITYQIGLIKHSNTQVKHILPKMFSLYFNFLLLNKSINAYVGNFVCISLVIRPSWMYSPLHLYNFWMESSSSFQLSVDFLPGSRGLLRDSFFAAWTRNNLQSTLHPSRWNNIPFDRKMWIYLISFFSSSVSLLLSIMFVTCSHRNWCVLSWLPWKRDLNVKGLPGWVKAK